MPTHIATRIALAFLFSLLLVQPSQGADQKTGFVTQVEGEGFFLNPVVTKILVTEVTKGSLAEAAGMKAGDQIIQIDGQNILGKRAMQLVPFMKLKPGETRTLRLKHADGTEAVAKITKPKA